MTKGEKSFPCFADPFAASQSVSAAAKRPMQSHNQNRQNNALSQGFADDWLDPASSATTQRQAESSSVTYSH